MKTLSQATSDTIRSKVVTLFLIETKHPNLSVILAFHQVQLIQ